MNNKEIIIEVEGEVKDEPLQFNVIPFYSGIIFGDSCAL